LRARQRRWDSIRCALVSSESSNLNSPATQESPGVDRQIDNRPRHGALALPIVDHNGRPDHSVRRTIPLLQRGLFAEHRNRGYTLFDAGSGAPVARLRPTGHEDRFEVLYWSPWKERWTSTGPFERTVLSINDALQFIAYEDIFWAMT
jgi:hypothetical protein